MKLRLYTDGSAGQRAIGMGAVLLWPDGVWQIGQRAQLDRADSTGAELLAIQFALSQVPRGQRSGLSIHLCCDSKSVVESLRRRKSVRGRGEITANVLRLLSEFAEWEATWVRGHSGQPFNEQAHGLAFGALRGNPAGVVRRKS